MRKIKRKQEWIWGRLWDCSWLSNFFFLVFLNPNSVLLWYFCLAGSLLDQYHPLSHWENIFSSSYRENEYSSEVILDDIPKTIHLCFHQGRCFYIKKKKKMRVYLASALLSVCSHGYVLIKGTWRPQVTFDGYYLSN